LISKTETQWRGGASGEPVQQVGLLIFFENFDRPYVLTTITDVPLLIVEKTARNSGVILQNHFAVREKKLPHL
jgi:hypothetical protein